ncbi:hypothetical protein GCM10010129_78820 [Streptomyces fumigatiscleroticus]|nr:hypothetical protein GCM10010129_78820 [Streptomyces fumigatiscleroticus]
MLGVIVVWLAVVCGSLATGNGPAAPGTPGAAALRTAAADAVRRQDPASFQRLFAARTVGPGYASRYFTELFAVPVTGLRVDLENRADLRFLVLRGERAGDGAICDAWTVQDSSGRSVLSGVPAVTDPCTGGRAARVASRRADRPGGT